MAITTAGAIVIGGCATTQAPAAAVLPDEAVYPGATWSHVARPETIGWSAEGLDAVRARLKTLPTTGFMVVVGGRVLLDYGDVAKVSYVASVRKSILSMLYGNYVASGAIRLDKTLEEIGIDDIGGLTTAEKQATVHDVLKTRSGIFHDASNAGDDLESAPARGSQAPGTYQLYSNWDFNVLGTIFERQSGRDIYDALESDLARPLQMQDFVRATHHKSGDLTRSIHPAYHMHLSTRDMARLGYLMLRNGAWRGRQVVPADWVRESTRAHTPVTEMNPARHRQGPFGYGYLWWVWDGPHATGAYRGAYAALGSIGQQIIVMPALDMVVVQKTLAGQGRAVSLAETVELLELLVRARSQA